MKHKIFWCGAFVYGSAVMITGTFLPITKHFPEPLALAFMALGFGIMAVAISATRKG